MSTHVHKTDWQRFEIWLIWVLVLGALLLALAPRAADFERTVLYEETTSRAAAPSALPRAEGLPFTAWDLVQYFSTVLEMSPSRDRTGAVFFENQQADRAEDRWRISVWSERKSVVVEFVAGGDYGISLAREFFESPLFESSETQALYGMLARVRAAPTEKLARFTVCLTGKETAKAQVLLMRFLAPGA